jgi:hypothetical protein
MNKVTLTFRKPYDNLRGRTQEASFCLRPVTRQLPARPLRITTNHWRGWTELKLPATDFVAAGAHSPLGLAKRWTLNSPRDLSDFLFTFCITPPTDSPRRVDNCTSQFVYTKYPLYALPSVCLFAPIRLWLS